MKVIVTAALIAAIAIAAAGCASTTHAAKTGTAATVTPAAAASTAPAPATSSPAPAPTARMTRKEAAAAYIAIVDPANRLGDALDRDWTDRAPWSQYVAGTALYVRAIRHEARQLRAARWPRRVQPYVTSMLITYDPASIRCFRAEAAAGSYSAAETVYYSNADCTAIDSNTDPDTIRSMLGLPSRY